MAMILKEAFRYQNYLDNLISTADSYLRGTNNVMRVVETHMRSKSQANAEDEVRDNISSRELSASPDTIINFVMKVLDEKVAVSRAINTAKIQHCPDMDMELGLNRARQQIQRVFSRMAALKNRTATTRGTDYCFNAEGNQVTYSYEIQMQTLVDFDKASLKEKVNSLSDTSTQISNAIDYWCSSVPVNHEPAFNINDTFEELVESLEAEA